MTGLASNLGTHSELPTLLDAGVKGPASPGRTRGIFAYNIRLDLRLTPFKSLCPVGCTTADNVVKQAKRTKKEFKCEHLTSLYAHNIPQYPFSLNPAVRKTQSLERAHSRHTHAFLFYLKLAKMNSA